MKYDQRFLKILFWETLENLPLFAGLLLAARLQSENWALAFSGLWMGSACGAGLIHLTEVKKYSNQPTLKETLVNFVVFSLLAVPFVFYVNANGAWWSNWGTDIVLGTAAGIGLAIGESWGWSNQATLKSHALSMALAAMLFLLGIRLINQLETPVAMLCVGLALTFLISLLIVQLEYWPIKEPALGSRSDQSLK